MIYLDRLSTDTMKLRHLLLLFLFSPFSLIANDGSFYASGGTLIPLQETTIALQKEILTLKRTSDGWLKVDILFEFNNPGPAKELMVGFVSPPTSGDVEEEGGHPEISDFKAMFDDALLPFEIKKLSDTQFHTAGFNSSADWSDYVYYFQVPFKNGLNSVRHSYTFRGGTSVDFQETYSYQITTGKRWANKEIEEFQLEIDMGDAFFFVPASFLASGQLAEWKINGIGRISATKDQLMAGEFDVRHVRTTTGSLHFSAKHFKPDEDIFFGIVQPYFQAHYWVDDEAIAEKFDRINTALITMPDSLAIAELSNEELRIGRNFWYAWHGYQFKDQTLDNLFRKCLWYIPDPSVTIEKINLDPMEKQSFDWIIAEEKRRK